ncbi:zinc ribbon domain-containing protein [Rhodomicrobium udaipurense]|uniref:zinc ribbon domain-containing protein n=1 Tax=Rhodomicrobium udaipurense TaxID=1202716 RepID=UPI0023EA754D|nr:zinc ribbon domain-containing protein [Rhodomicrobium udaipurense]
MKVQTRLGSTARGGKGFARKHRLLSGLTKCGKCGGGMAISGSTDGRVRISCVRARDAGVCDHKRSYYLDRVEAVVAEAFVAVLSQKDVMQKAIGTAIKKRREDISGEAKAYSRAEGGMGKSEGPACNNRAASGC